jgi:arylsulfatase A-like enzyme
VANRALALGALALAVGACERGGPVRLPPPPRPHLLLISLDTVRADALGSYSGATPSRTPSLDALAARGVRFERALAPIAFTLPSHMTMFTGLYPDAHGVVDKTTRLSAAVRTLPELLRDAGYQSFGLASNAWMNGDYGFARGFARYAQLRFAKSEEVYADRVNAEALALLDREAEPGHPIFLFLHYLDAHSDWKELPYDSPPALRADLPTSPREFCTPAGGCATRFLLALDRARSPVPEELRAKLHELYRRGVQALDAELGRLFEALVARGFLQHAIVVVTSDHGEEFREHGRFGHAQTYDESLSVPLIAAFPDGRDAGRVVGAPVELVDLLPTLLDWLGLPAPPGAQGQSLAVLARGAADARTRAPALAQDKGVPTRYALRGPRFKLVRDTASGAEELYDLAADPGERTNLAATETERASALRALLETRLAAVRAAAAARRPDPNPAPVLTPEDERQLREIGYLD